MGWLMASHREAVFVAHSSITVWKLAGRFGPRLSALDSQLSQRAAMSERIPMTRAGYNKIKAELNVLENEQMPEIEKRIATARAEGDLSENAEYHGARESQGMLQAKINLLRDKLARS